MPPPAQSDKDASSADSGANTSLSSSPSSSSQRRSDPSQSSSFPTAYPDQVYYGAAGSLSSQSQSPTPLPPINPLQYANPAIAQLPGGMQPQQWGLPAGNPQLQASMQGNLPNPMGLPTYQWGYPNPGYYPFRDADLTNVYGTMQLDSNRQSPDPVYPTWVPDQGFPPPFLPVQQQSDQPMTNPAGVYPPDDLVAILRGQGYSPSEWFGPRSSWPASMEPALPGSTTTQPMDLSVAGSPLPGQFAVSGTSASEVQPRQRMESDMGNAQSESPNPPQGSPDTERSPPGPAGKRIVPPLPKPDGPRRGRRGKATDRWLKELAEIESRTGEHLDPSERRKMQNRVAQRLARARSKMGNAETASHTLDLESEVAAQHDELDRFRALVASLQKENKQLKRQLQQQGSAAEQNEPQAETDRDVRPEQGESTAYQNPYQQPIEAGGSAAFPSEVDSSAYSTGRGEPARRAEAGQPTRPANPSHSTASGSNVLSMRGGQDGPSLDDDSFRGSNDAPTSDDGASSLSRSRSLPSSSGSDSTAISSLDLRRLERLMSELRTSGSSTDPASSSSEEQISGDQGETAPGSAAGSKRSSTGSDATSPPKGPVETPNIVSRKKDVDI